MSFRLKQKLQCLILQNNTFSLKDDNTTRKSMLKLVRMVQKLKNDKNQDDSLLFSWALFTFVLYFIGPVFNYGLTVLFY